MSTSTVAALVTTSVDTLWSYLSVILPVLIPVAIGLAVLFGGIYFVLRRVHVIR